MSTEQIINLVVAIVGAIFIVLPLAVLLVKFVIENCKNKNWSVLVTYAVELMKQAEELYDNGADRKEWVLAMIEENAKLLNYEFDADKLSQIIDIIIAATKVINK